MDDAKITYAEWVATLATSRELRDAAYELHRLWRHGWDVPGSSGYQSYVMAHRRMSDLYPEYRGSFVQLAKDILAAPREPKPKADA